MYAIARPPYSTAQQPERQVSQAAADGDGDRQPRRADPDDAGEQDEDLEGGRRWHRDGISTAITAVPLQCGHGALGLSPVEPFPDQGLPAFSSEVVQHDAAGDRPATVIATYESMPAGWRVT